MWAIEVRRRGIQPQRFASKADAELFAGATYPWLGVQWRVVFVKEKK